MDINLKHALRRLTLADIQAQADRVKATIGAVRGVMLSPNATKVPPSLSAGELAELCGTTKPVIAYRAGKGDLPEGRMSGNKKVWSTQEAQQWARAFRAEHLRPQGALAVTLCLANFKGGVSKTTTTVTLAQALSLRGHKVLVIDLDPQGSTTTLFGVSPTLDVEDTMTAERLFASEEQSIEYAIRSTYWPGIDLVPANPLLFNAEFSLPSQQKTVPRFEFWRILDRGLDQARETYDVILIDTAPMLSYIVINALMAADGVVIPMPPATVDFASSEHFWQLMYDLLSSLLSSSGQSKSFEFINVLLARVESDSSVTGIVKQWVNEAFGDKVLPVEIPKTAATATASAEFGTIYDMPRGSIDSKTYARARSAYDALAALMEQQIEAVWARQLDELALGGPHE